MGVIISCLMTRRLGLINDLDNDNVIMDIDMHPDATKQSQPYVFQPIMDGKEPV